MLKTRLATRQLDTLRYGKRHISPGECEAAYLYAYAALEIISKRLDSGRYHYRSGDGRLLEKLDEVISAIIAGELAAEAGELERAA